MKSPPTETSGKGRARGAFRRYSWMLDAAIILILLLTAFAVRRDGLPRDGLFHDDAWVALGAAKGSFSQLMTVGHAHPGFTGALMVWSDLLGHTAATMAYPALIAGTVGPAALYLVLRRFGYALSTSALLSAALLASNLHVRFSGRVKSYVVDVLILLVLTAVLPRLCAMRWRWYTGAVWLGAAMVLASFSGISLLASAAAAGVLVLHPSGDRSVRIVAATIQGIGSVVLLAIESSHHDSGELEHQWEVLFDPFLDIDPNPLRLGGEVFEHLGRVAMVFPGGDDSWAKLFIVVAIAGLAIGSLTNGHRAEAIRARFLVLCLLVALAGGFARMFPFGPGGVGNRYSLWMIPVVAFGLAVALSRVRGAVPAPLRFGTDAVACVTAVLVGVLALTADPVSYPVPGSRSAVNFVEAQADDRTAVFVLGGGFYQFAFETEFEVALRADRTTVIGYLPEFATAPVHLVPADFRSETIGAALTRAERVLIFIALPLHVPESSQALQRTVAALGFERQDIGYLGSFGFVGVQVWHRVAGAAPRNAQTSSAKRASVSPHTPSIAVTASESRAPSSMGSSSGTVSDFLQK